MAVNLAPGPFGAGGQFFDTNGKPLNAGFINTYAAGTTTPLATYTTSVGNVANATTITLGVDGRPPNEIWLSAGSSYRFDLLDSSNNLIKTYDNLSGINDISGIGEWVLISLSPVFISTTSFSLTGNQTTLLPNGIRIKTVNTGGTVYGEIVSGSYSAIPNTTTFVVASDPGTALDIGLSSVSYSILSPVNPSIDSDYVLRKASLVTSAGVTNIWAITGDYVHVTPGSVTSITSLGTAFYAGNERTIVADGPFTITGAAIQNLGVASISLLAGDKVRVRAETTTIASVVSYRTVRPLSRTTLTSGVTQTYTVPAGVIALNVRLIGGGAGGGAQATNPGTSGNATTFSTLTGGGGSPGNIGGGVGGNGGLATGGDVNIPGGSGTGGTANSVANVNPNGGSGGNGKLGGGGGGGGSGAAGLNAATNSGGGGGGAGGGSGQNSAAGGGSGGYVEKFITGLTPTYTYTVGAAANGGAAGTVAGGNGAAGIIIIDELFD